MRLFILKWRDSYQRGEIHQWESSTMLHRGVWAKLGSELLKKQTDKKINLKNTFHENMGV